MGEICGIDEAGRGPLAGPLVVSGVILLKDIDGLDDSKKLSEKRRELLCEKIVESSIFQVVFLSNKMIDSIGLSACIKLALLKITDKLDASKYIFDGNCSYGIQKIEHMIKADSKIKEVGAASILAKVFRDNYMKKMALKYPQYGFAKHKGYGSKTHIELMQKHGLCKIHRKSFKLKNCPSLFDFQ